MTAEFRRSVPILPCGFPRLISAQTGTVQSRFSLGFNVQRSTFNAHSLNHENHRLIHQVSWSHLKCVARLGLRALEACWDYSRDLDLVDVIWCFPSFIIAYLLAFPLLVSSLLFFDACTDLWE